MTTRAATKRIRNDGKPRDDAGNLVPEYERKPTGKMIPCEGASGRENHWAQDYCTICAPRWGEVPEYAPTDMAEAKRQGLAVPYYDTPREMFDEIQADVKAGRAEEINVTRRYKGGNASHYLVVRWRAEVQR